MEERGENWSWNSIGYRGPEAKLELVGAYERTFNGGASLQDRQAVLADLADISGFYNVLPRSSDFASLSFGNGARSVFGRIISMINLTHYEREALQGAAQVQTLLTTMEEEI